MEENQSMQTSQPVSSLRTETDAFNKFKEDSKKRISNDRGLRRSKEGEALYEKSLTSTNPELCGQYDRACKAGELARGARAYGASKGYDWSNVEDVDLLNQYSALFPESNRIMYDYLTQPEETDPTPYYIKLGWEQPTEEDEANSWFKNMRWSFDKAGRGLLTMQNANNMYDGSGYINAIRDYASDVYGRKHPFSAITEEEWKAVERDIRIDPSILDKYTNFNNGAKDLAIGGTVSALNAVTKGKVPVGLLGNLGVTGLATTKPGEEILGTIGEGAETVGYYANKFPGLKQYRDSLATEEDKRERDMFVGSEILALISRGAIKGYKEIKTLANEGGTGGGGGFAGGLWKKFQESRAAKNQEKLQEVGGKITGAKTVKEQEIATRGLQDADIKGTKTYDELSERLANRGKEIEAAEDIEYAKDERKFKPQDTRYMKTFEKDGYSSSVLEKPIERGIELLKDFYEGSPDKMAQLDLIEQKFKTEGLTKGEMNNIARAIADEYETYRKRGEPKTSITAKDVEGIRKAVKEFVREGNENLTKLDKQWSDNLNTKAMVNDLRDAITKFKANKRYKNIFQKLAGVAGDIFNYFGGKELLSKVFDKAAGDPNYTPITRMSDLKKLTNKFSKLDKKINGAKSRETAEKIVEEFNEDMEREFGAVEGEVVEDLMGEKYKEFPNPGLEDIVESEDYPFSVRAKHRETKGLDIKDINDINGEDLSNKPENAVREYSKENTRAEDKVESKTQPKGETAAEEKAIKVESDVNDESSMREILGKEFSIGFYNESAKGNTKVYTNQEKSAVISITDDGEIKGFYRKLGANSNVGDGLILKAIEQGGNRLTTNHNLIWTFEDLGFEVVGKQKGYDEYFMVHNFDDLDTIKNNKGKYKHADLAGGNVSRYEGDDGLAIRNGIASERATYDIRDVKGWDGKKNLEGFAKKFSSEKDIHDYVEREFKRVGGAANKKDVPLFDKEVAEAKEIYNGHIDTKSISLVYRDSVKRLSKIMGDGTEEIKGAFRRNDASLHVGLPEGYTVFHEFSHGLDYIFGKELTGQPVLLSDVARGALSKDMTRPKNLSTIGNIIWDFVDIYKDIVKYDGKPYQYKVGSRRYIKDSTEKFARFGEGFLNYVKNGKTTNTTYGYIYSPGLFQRFAEWLGRLDEARTNGMLHDGTLYDVSYKEKVPSLGISDMGRKIPNVTLFVEE